MDGIVRSKIDFNKQGSRFNKYKNVRQIGYENDENNDSRQNATFFKHFSETKDDNSNSYLKKTFLKTAKIEVDDYKTKD